MSNGSVSNSWDAYNRSPIGQLEKRMFPGFAQLAIDREDLDLVRIRIHGSGENQAIIGILSSQKTIQDLPVYNMLPSIATKNGARYLEELSYSKPVSIGTMGRQTLISNSPVMHLQTGTSRLSHTQLRVITDELFGGFLEMKKTISSGIESGTYELSTSGGSRGPGERGAVYRLTVTDTCRDLLNAWVRALGYTPAVNSSPYLVWGYFNSGSSGEISIKTADFPLRNGVKWVIFGGGGLLDWNPEAAIGEKFDPVISSQHFTGAILIPIVDDGSPHMPVVNHSVQGTHSLVAYLNDPRYAHLWQQQDPLPEAMLGSAYLHTGKLDSFTWPGSDWYYSEIPKGIESSGGPPGLVPSPLDLGSDVAQVYYTRVAEDQMSYTQAYISADRHLLPLIGAPGDYNMAIIGTDPVWSMTKLWEGTNDEGLPRTVRLWTLDVTQKEMHLSIPFEWYGRYVTTGYGFFTPLEGARLEEAMKVVEKNRILALTCSQYEAQTLPKDIVTRLDIYKKYSKARKKNCKDNDFMQKEFVSGVRWKQVDNHFRNLNVAVSRFYGVLDASAASAAARDLFPMKHISFVFIPGANQGQGAGTLTVTPLGAVNTHDAVAVYDALSQGARLTQGTLEQLEMFFGASTAEGTTVDLQDLSATTAEVAISSNPVYAGRSAGTLDFSSKSISRNGYPAYWEMTTQDAYKCAIASEIVYKNAGSRMVRALLGFGSSALATSMWNT